MPDNLVNDVMQQIVDEKPQKSKVVIKWLIRVGIFLIGAAFAYGQYKMGELNKLQEIKKSIEILQAETQNNTDAINNMQVSVNTSMTNMKNEGYEFFKDYQKYSKNQFELLIDYGSTNKELLKRMIALNEQEKTQEVKAKIEQSKLSQQTFDPSAFGVSFVVSAQAKDTVFFAKNASQEFVNNIKKKYNVNKINPSIYKDNLFDVTYQNY